jgi:hypothetical protein
MAAKMLPFETPFQKMHFRVSNAANVVRFAYEAPNVFYNNPLFTFNYTTYRGNLSNRVRQGVVMESNNGSL